MRNYTPILLLFALLNSYVSAAAVEKQHKPETVENALSKPKAEPSIQDGPKAGATNSEAVAVSNTKFNGMEVPPMKELTAEKMEKDIKQGYYFIKHYSPYCGHCKDIAPTWQTLYEFYYTQKPVPGKKDDKDSMNSFTRYYDFHFASLDCIAFGDACTAHEVDGVPNFTVFKDGVLFKKFESQKTLEGLSKFVEEILETIRPGSRPTEGLKLPEVGATSVKSGSEKGKTDVNTETKKSGGKVEEEEDTSKTPKTGAKKSVEKQDTKGDPAEKQKSTGKQLSEKTSSKQQPLEKASTEEEKPAEKAKGETTKAKDKLVSSGVSETVDATSSTETSKAPHKGKSTPKKKKPSGPPNPTGNSVALSHESFQKLVTNTQEPWFVKAFAPWCHHCQALAPSWLQMAKELQNKLNIGEINCDAESRLCKDLHVKAYPTIFFFRGGERIEYSGLRGLGDLVSFAKKALDVGQGVPNVNLQEFRTMEETEDVIFIYFYDHATVSEDFEALERLTLSLVGHAKLVKTNDSAMAEEFKISTWPRFVVSRSGRVTLYEALAPKDMRDFRGVLSWMQKVWLPLVPELTASNAREIMKNKYVVLGILNREKADEFELDKREMKNAALEWMEKQTHAFELERKELRDAKQLRLEEAEDRDDDRAKRAAKSIHIDIREDDKKQVGFAWVDGVFWERWIRTTYGINVRDGERVIINDEDNRRYWDMTISGAAITPSRTSILETIPKVISSPPKISSKSSTGWIQRIFFGFTGMLTGHPILSAIMFVAAAILGYRSHNNRKRGGISLPETRGRSRGFSLPVSRGGFLGLEEKLGGLGGIGNGKAD